MTPLWQRFSNLSPEAKETIHQEMIDLARKLGREGAERDKLKPRHRNDDARDAEEWMHHSGEYDYTQLPGF